MKVSAERCHHCGACVGSCPQNAIFMNDFVLEFGDACNRCKRCIRLCPAGAISEEG
ncbi:MAG: 4Fe-4S binding protein [Euryarchaeota archaeon]|nr:4Fe-4S binding protein [Euryarchaeota archaeon]